MSELGFSGREACCWSKSPTVAIVPAASPRSEDSTCHALRIVAAMYTVNTRIETCVECLLRGHDVFLVELLREPNIKASQQQIPMTCFYVVRVLDSLPL